MGAIEVIELSHIVESTSYPLLRGNKFVSMVGISCLVRNFKMKWGRGISDLLLHSQKYKRSFEGSQDWKTGVQAAVSEDSYI